MSFYDEKIQMLRLQIEQKKHIASKLKELYVQRENLVTKVHTLRKNKLEEQADVTSLEGSSLVAFFYEIIGKMDQKLDKEREEAYAAKVKYDAAVHEQQAVEEDILRYEAALEALCDCEQEYAQIKQYKLEDIKSLGTQEAELVVQTEERIAYLEGQLKEIQEALHAGETALETTDGILSSLASAENWSTWDLLGGGLLTDMAKHSHLDEAQQQVEYLQIQLRRFKTELTDVSISADIQISIEGFLSFADYFFDGLFADWTVMNRINQSQTQVADTKAQIEHVISNLTTALHTVGTNLENEKTKLNDLISNIRI